MRHLDAEYVHGRFPTITRACRDAGFDLATDRIPISPAAHYVMGGVETDLDGRTSVARLFAAGEAASTGVHGANRLASNSLLEGLVFGARAAAAMIDTLRPASLFSILPDPVDAPLPGSEVPKAFQVRDLMWRAAGLVRSRGELEPAVDQLGSWQAAAMRRRAEAPDDRDLRRVTSLLTVGYLIARAALRREESRGGHFRADFPQRDDIHWRKHFADVLRTS
jgi:L-aspartate oxidase